MEDFDIQLLDITYTIHPQQDGSFQVMEGEDQLGTVYPEPGTLEMEWKSTNDMGDDFATQIGELISEHELGKSIL